MNHPRAALKLAVDETTRRGTCFCGLPVGHDGYFRHIDEWLNAHSGEASYHDLYRVGEQ